MIIIDTNVLSELTRPAPDVVVLGWLDSMPDSETATTAVTAAEMLHGVARLPDGRRKEDLAAEVMGLLSEDFRGRILPFDERAAQRYAQVLLARQRAGRPIETHDAQIAAICLSRGATLATRNTKDFDGTGVQLVNPWET